jgi:hypothetical protein
MAFQQLEMKPGWLIKWQRMDLFQFVFMFRATFKIMLVVSFSHFFIRNRKNHRIIYLEIKILGIFTDVACTASVNGYSVPSLMNHCVNIVG